MDKISWQAPEYFHTEKTNDWYWIVAIITISIALISVILNNIIFAILIIVSSFTLCLFASKRPLTVEIQIDNSGIVVDKTRYPFAHLESFWIETREIHPKILIKSEKIFMPFIVIFIEGIEIEKVHEMLSRHLPEEEHTEPFLEKLLIYFGF